MNPDMLNDLCASVVRRLNLSPTTVEAALLVTLHHFSGESHNPAVAYTGLTPDQYVLLSLSTPRFEATLASAALEAEGREADARLNWEAFVQREQETARLAHEAIPKTALLADADAIHRIGRQLGLCGECTDQLVSGVVLTLALGYPYRLADQRHLSLTDLLAQVTTEELTELLRHAAHSATGRTEEAAATLRRMQRAAR
ncbi:hypothetical protein PV367_12570 [Streptomyces europaeiscabiei]|uniref:Uncharacterized protein n=1 Tax=Streptomyces europaeiscabiei TaxID=146819 RepID=A0AAJ2PN85_9ACTN|nr:hypothetical protein [Streptomyces europaeiscabiei]MDX3130608.1 hypothetical protein [Streptomyces europaeiscabiei]